MLNKIWTPSNKDLGLETKYIKSEIVKIGNKNIQKLVETALNYRENAYAPYSNYKVGASLLTIDGQIFGGCNSESVAYSPTNHAEGTAIAKANSEGSAKKIRKYIKAIAICHEGDTGPCGECLQRIVEHADNCLVIVASSDGEIRKITSLKAIFPYNFNPSHLGK